jgi:hypothetical protein
MSRTVRLYCPDRPMTSWSPASAVSKNPFSNRTDFPITKLGNLKQQNIRRFPGARVLFSSFNLSRRRQTVFGRPFVGSVTRVICLAWHSRAKVRARSSWDLFLWKSLLMSAWLSGPRVFSAPKIALLIARRLECFPFVSSLSNCESRPYARATRCFSSFRWDSISRTWF